MKRNISQLTSTEFDVLIVGGGIYGLFTAWDAALRGLRVALLEKNDFGNATSFNSLRVIHGGLRYLQHGHVRRMRESICERSTFLRMAPHLVKPLPFLFPTYGHGLRGKEIFAVALFLNDLIGFDRNHGVDSAKRLPSSRLLSKREFCDIVPGFEDGKATGAALCFDAQVENSERFTIGVARSAALMGAELANYVEVTGPLRVRNGVGGVLARDVLTQESIEVRAKIVVNASGPWVNQVFNRVKPHEAPLQQSYAKAFNLLIKRQLIPTYSLGVYSQSAFQDNDALVNKGSRLYILTPWRQYSLIGTEHATIQSRTETWDIEEKEIQEFLEEINRAYPIGGIQRNEVKQVFGGLLPVEGKFSHETQLTKQHKIIETEGWEGITQFLTVVGVKFTEARHVAERTVDLIGRRLDQPLASSTTAQTSIVGGYIPDIEEYIRTETSHCSEKLSAESVVHLISNYGTTFKDVVNLSCEDPALGDQIASASPSVKAEIIHAIENEMAMKLTDVLLRRTTLALDTELEDSIIHSCAKVMSGVRGWSKEEVGREISEVKVSSRCCN